MKCLQIGYGLLLLLLIGVTIWAAFNIRERFPVVVAVQVPVLLLRAIRIALAGPSRQKE